MVQNMVIFPKKKFLFNILTLPLLVGLISNHFHITLSIGDFLNYSDKIISFFANSSISISPEIAEYFSIVGGVLGIALLTLWFAKLAIFHLILWFFYAILSLQYLAQCNAIYI